MDNLPAGFRQGLITAITVFLAFTLYLIRYWGLETNSGAWTIGGYVSILIVFIGLLLQCYTLMRALRLQDENKTEYSKTVKWFMASIFTVFLSLIVSAIGSML